MTTTTKKVKSEYTERAIYTGRRLGIDGKVRQRFELLPDGTEMYFRGVKRVWIGHTYECGKENISGRPKRLDVERVDNDAWETADALVDARNAERRAEAKIAASAKPAIKAAIDVLTPLFKNLSYFDRKSLIEYLAVQAVQKSKRGRK